MGQARPDPCQLLVVSGLGLTYSQGVCMACYMFAGRYRNLGACGACGASSR